MEVMFSAPNGAHGYGSKLTRFGGLVSRWQDADARVSVSDESPDPLERHCRGVGQREVQGVDS